MSAPEDNEIIQAARYSILQRAAQAGLSCQSAATHPERRAHAGNCTSKHVGPVQYLRMSFREGAARQSTLFRALFQGCPSVERNERKGTKLPTIRTAAMRTRRSAPGTHCNPLRFISKDSKDDNTWRLGTHKRYPYSSQCYGFHGNYHSISSKGMYNAQ